MKKKPREIFSILLNSLNNLEIGKEYSINEISENSGLHWYTTNDYLEILNHFNMFAPTIHINERNKKVKVMERSRYYDNLTVSQKILLNLFEKKAFDEHSAISLKDSNFNLVNIDDDLELYIDDLEVKKQIQVIPPKQSEDKDTAEYFIQKNGKEIVHSIYNKITTELFSADKNQAESFMEDLKNPIEEIESLRKHNTELQNEKNVIIKQNSELIRQLGVLIESLFNEDTDTQSLTFPGRINPISRTLSSRITNSSSYDVIDDQDDTALDIKKIDCVN